MGLLQDITIALTPVGLNLIGTTSIADYEALVPPQYHVSQLRPEAKTIIVIGNGGGAFWQHFRDYTKARPGYLQEHEHPLDDYTVEIIEAGLSRHLDEAHLRYHYIYPFQFFSGLTVSFMHLAQAAGLAGPSILGVQIHPTFGPWMALRAAILVNQESPDFATPQTAAGFDPCPSCEERPCITACPAHAINAEKGWDVPSCVQHRIRTSTDCIDRCHARYNCVYGRAHRYPEDELEYHQRLSFAAMREYFEKQEK